MFESDSICLQVLSHWTRCEKRFMAVFIHPQVPRVRDRLDSDSICCVLACSVSWFLRAFYARALDRIFWYWNLFIWRLILKIFQSLAQMLILKLSSFIFDSSTVLRPSPNNVEFQSLKLILGISISLVQTCEWGIFETTSIVSANIVSREAWLQKLKSWCWLLLWQRHSV